MTKEPSSGAIAAAQYLFDAIRSHSPDFLGKMPPAKVGQRMLRWAKTIDVGFRNDGMDLEGSKVAIDAAHRSSDPFWRLNLLSGAKLRKHYEKLRLRGQGSDKPTQGYGPGYTSDGERLDEIDYDIYGTGAS